MKAPLSYLPALPAAVGWIAGILLWWYGAPWWAVAASGMVGLVMMLIRRQYLAFGLYALVAGWIVAEANRPADAPDWIFDGRERMVAGILEMSMDSPRSHTMVVTVDSVELRPGVWTAVAPFGLQLSSLPQWLPLPIGSRIVAVAEIEPLPPGGLFPYQADYSTLFLRRGVVAEAFVEEENIRATGFDPSVKAWFARRQCEIVHILAHSGLSDDACALLTALVAGEDGELSESLRENFRITGVAHALALSGFHVGVIVMLVGFALFPLRAFRRLMPLRMLLVIVALWFYAGMVGLPDSVVRAAVMVSVYLIATMIGRGANPFNSLCVAVLVILAVSPFSLFSAGFQLSVCAVIGILVFARHFNPFSPKNGWRFRVAEAVSVTLAAVLGTMVPTLLYFHRFPLLFMFANIVVTALLPLLMFGGVAVVVAGCFACRMPWLEWTLNHLVNFIDSFTGWLARFGWNVIDGVYLTGWQAMFIVLVTVALGVAVGIRRRWAWISLGCCAALCLSGMPLCVARFPESEAFIVGNKATAPVLVRQASEAVLIPRCRPHRVVGSIDRAMRDLRDYFSVCGVDTVRVISDDFVLGPYERRGNLIVRHRDRVSGSLTERMD